MHMSCEGNIDIIGRVEAVRVTKSITGDRENGRAPQVALRKAVQDCLQIPNSTAT